MFSFLWLMGGLGAIVARDYQRAVMHFQRVRVGMETHERVGPNAACSDLFDDVDAILQSVLQRGGPLAEAAILTQVVFSIFTGNVEVYADAALLAKIRAAIKVQMHYRRYENASDSCSNLFYLEYVGNGAHDAAFDAATEGLEAALKIGSYVNMEIHRRQRAWASFRMGKFALCNTCLDEWSALRTDDEKMRAKFIMLDLLSTLLNEMCTLRHALRSIELPHTSVHITQWLSLIDVTTSNAAERSSDAGDAHVAAHFSLQLHATHVLAELYDKLCNLDHVSQAFALPNEQFILDLVRLFLGIFFFFKKKIIIIFFNLFWYRFFIG